MARKPFSQEARAKGYKALLKSKSKRAEGLKAYARKWLREHGYSASIVLLALMCLAAPASAQRANTLYADQFRDRASTVGGMVTLAQQGCAADTSVPCQIVIDGILAVFPTGVIPVPCAQCIQIDYRTIGQVKVANAANTTLTQVWPAAVGSFPLLGPNDQTCNPAKSFGTVADGTGLSFTTGVTVFCFGTIRRWAATATVWESGSGGIYCWGSAIDATGACDAGLSRGAGNQINFGNGTAADRSAALLAASLNLTGNVTAATGTFSGAISVGSCAGCASGFKVENTNTTVVTGTTVAATTLQTFSLPANEIAAGQDLHWEAWGTWANGAAATVPTLTFNVDGVAMCSTSWTASAASQGPIGWHWVIDVNALSNAAAEVHCHLATSRDNAQTVAANVFDANTTTKAIDFTGIRALTTKVTWDVAATGGLVYRSSTIVRQN